MLLPCLGEGRGVFAGESFRGGIGGGGSPPSSEVVVVVVVVMLSGKCRGARPLEKVVTRVVREGPGEEEEEELVVDI